jgi:hypothetical protein
MSDTAWNQLDARLASASNAARSPAPLRASQRSDDIQKRIEKY